MEVEGIREAIEKGSHLIHVPKDKNRENGTWLNSKGKSQKITFMPNQGPAHRLEQITQKGEGRWQGLTGLMDRVICLSIWKNHNKVFRQFLLERSAVSRKNFF